MLKTKALLVDQASELEDLIKSFGFEYLDCVSRDIDARILIENKNKYDIIFYNTEIIQKPIDFLAFLKKMGVPESIDFILISQCSKKEELVSAAFGGIDDFIVKPTSKEKLTSRLHNLYSKKTITLLNTIEKFCIGALAVDSISGKNENRTKSNFELLSKKLSVLSSSFEIIGEKRKSDLFFLLSKACIPSVFEEEKIDTIFQHLISLTSGFNKNLSEAEERARLLFESIYEVRSAESKNPVFSEPTTETFLSKIKIGIENDRLKNF